MQVRRTMALAGVLALALTACGGDDDDAATPASDGGSGGSELTVIAEDIAFPEDTYQADAGTIDVVYENEGVIEHTLLVEGVDDFELTVDANGDVDEGSVDLDAGTYTLYCDVPGHQEGGMVATLEVG
ncbi:plastocyanin/azurin family copper-binding protein [Acidimicrobiia bacterium EGI L10123]|uniref:plastocyanin/azurin family copper-binding protein n=1 Tax=Salinilacustrithrix flava TaxID=2957203 RepID=UPI003D7C3036|nr:plastocyanin/azurin family copper-binding protein [Acidimicrobiia bacterium EGI L10123]